MEIAIDFTALTALREQLSKSPGVVREELLAAMTEADQLVLRALKEETPRASGLLRTSEIAVEKVNELSVEGLIGSPLNYARPVDLGTKPHFPPVEALMDWVRVKLGISNEKEARGVAFLIARKISRVGTKGADMSQKALAQTEEQIRAIFERAQRRIAERMVGAA